MTTARWRILSSRVGIPIGRVSVPDDVARIAAFLASDEASYMTGESINLSGGLLMG